MGDLQRDDETQIGVSIFESIIAVCLPMRYDVVSWERKIMSNEQCIVRAMRRHIRDAKRLTDNKNKGI